MAIPSLVAATGVLTATGVLQNTETVVIGGKTYTFQTSLTDVDGNVKVGADLAASIANLYNAINLGTGAGTAYAASMTANPAVLASAYTATTLTVKALSPGTIGNLVATTETAANASWGAAVLQSGAGSANAYITAVLAERQVSSDLILLLRPFTVANDG